MSGYSKYLKNKDVCCTPGPPGQRGERGPTGVYGPQGLTGPTGSTGSMGAPGTASNTGATGPAGTPGLVVQYVYKNTGFTENLKNVVTTASPFNITPSYAVGANNGGYSESITPLSNQSRIKVQFKVKYQGANTKLKMGIVYTIDSGATYTLLGQDTVGGPTVASGLFTETYAFNFMHWPNTTNRITYTLFFQLDTAPTSQAYMLGVLGDNPSDSNYIILEEYLGIGGISLGVPQGIGATLGSTGHTGFTGSVGYTGSVGADGATGATGAAGSAGADGSVGATGATGATGAVGSAGADGSVGATGATGAVGAVGAAGSVGATGATGAAGSLGPTGAKGDRGDSSIGVNGSVYGDYLYWNGASWAVGSDKVTIGAGAGSISQGNYAVAIGRGAGYSSQGTNAIAIGYNAGQTQQAAGSIVIDASGGFINAAYGGFYVAPVRSTTSTGNYMVYNKETGEVQYSEATIFGATGAAGPAGLIGPTGPGTTGIYANDTWLLTNLLGQPPAVVFGTPIYTSEVIYIPWIYPTQNKVGWGADIWLPSITMCTVFITAGNKVYNVAKDSIAGVLVNGSTTVLAITKNYAGVGFTTPIDNIGVDLVCKYGNAELSPVLTPSSVSTITVFYTNTSSFSPSYNPSSLQFYGFLADASGTVIIVGPAVVGTQLSASHNISDQAGVNQITYQWYSVSNGTPTAISGATNPTYTLIQGDIGKSIYVTVSYKTDNDVTKSIMSNTTSPVVARTNYPHTGEVIITGFPAQGETLTASNNLSDPDGIVGPIVYGWYRDGTGIKDSSGNSIVGPSYTLTQADVGRQVYVTAFYTDNYGRAEAVPSALTAIVSGRLNNPYTGEVIISGTARVGETLTASNNLDDPDGIVPPITYTWIRRNPFGTVGTGSTYTLTQADVGMQFYVTAFYKDNYDRGEFVPSAFTPIVSARGNNLPTGTVTIIGTAQVGETLTASNNIADLDGIVPPITYGWHHGYGNNPFTTGPTYVISESDIGKIIVLVAYYIDGYGVSENVTSAPTAVVSGRPNYPHTGNVVITGTPVEGQTLTASNNLDDPDGIVGPINYLWYRSGIVIKDSSGNNIVGASYTLTQADVGGQIQVVASYTDNYDRKEYVGSASTPIVTARQNNPPTGTVTITGTAQVGQTLIASNNIVDQDGVNQITYTWYRKGEFSFLTGFTGPSYTVLPADVGFRIFVVASYIDNYSNQESIASADTSIVPAPVDTPYTGGVTISGSPLQGERLTASNNIVDPDGIVGGISYLWYRNNESTNTFGSVYDLTPADVGFQIKVVASFTDTYGTSYNVPSGFTAVITRVNNLPTGTVTITGIAEVGQTLTASNNLSDSDGIVGAISYLWYRNNLPTGVTGSIYALTQDDVGFRIYVEASYTDGYGKLENVASALTAVVTRVNNPPTGTVTITGIAQVGQILTASNNLEDIDGMGPITYAWHRENGNYSLGTGPTYVIVPADIGYTIAVDARYTDGFGQFEAVRSAPTAIVTARQNNPPTGTVTITGSTVQGETLTASNNIVDPDGIVGAIAYTWFRNDPLTALANGSTYQLTQADVGFQINVRASYTDTYGTGEFVSSAKTAIVTARPNNPPTGTVTITGTAQVGQTLIASNNIVDQDGVNQITYTWYRKGEFSFLTGFTGPSYTVLPADVGFRIFVVASYIDNYSNQESIASADTSIVPAPVDTPYTGGVTISGSPLQGERLTASNNIVDPDGIVGGISYLWYRNNESTNTFGSVYDLTPADVGFQIKVVASFTDTYGTRYNVPSGFTAVITRVNNPPTGEVTITGDTVEGKTLTAVKNFDDYDGIVPPIVYSWFRNNAPTGVTGSSYPLTQADVGFQMQVSASYTDGYGTQELVFSAKTPVITGHVNNPPTGTVTITGIAQVGQILTASNTLADIDGLGEITYGWHRGYGNNAVATGPTYVIVQADIGFIIAVDARYTDGFGKSEHVPSAPTAVVVARPNTLPTGTVTITGNTEVGQTLTASNNIVDPDGIVLPITYKWYRNDVLLIQNSTNSTYVLTLNDAGTQIKVVASYTDAYGTPESVSSSAITIPAVVVPDEPPALTRIFLSTGSYTDVNSTIYRVSDQVSIGPVPLIKETQVATLQFDAPVHRLANRGAGNNNSLMTLSASLNSTAGPSVVFGGFLISAPLQAVTTNNITITPNSVTDYYAGQTGKTGYYLMSRDTITATGLSAGGNLNTLTATQTFDNANGAPSSSASVTFYYDTPVTSAPTGSINALSISSSKRVSGLSILYDTSANLTIDATAINMGKYFYRSPLITYSYTYPIDAVSGSTSVTKSETTLTNVRPSDISGTMFTDGTLNFSSSVALTGINNSAYFKRSIAVDAYSNNIFGAGGTTSRSLNIIMDPLSHALVYQTQPSSIPILTASTAALPTLIPGFRIWSAPITTNASAPAGTLCPDLSYNGILYYTIPYDNAGSLTSTDPTGCGRELLISNGIFSTPTKNPSAYIDYSSYAGNPGLDYSTILNTTGTYRFATFCWKLPALTKALTNLIFTINSIYNLNSVDAGVIQSNGENMSIFYAFQNADNPSSFPSSNSRIYNSVWINANLATTIGANATTFANSYNNVRTRFGSLGQLSLDTTPPNSDVPIASGTATFNVFIPVTSPIPPNVYLYLRIGLPLNKDCRFGSVRATYY